MHSIERYGAIALIFLVVTVMAVLMWDSEESSSEPAGSRLARAPASSSTENARAADPAAGREKAKAERPEVGPGDAIATLSSRPRPLRRDIEPRLPDGQAARATREARQPAVAEDPRSANAAADELADEPQDGAVTPPAGGASPSAGSTSRPLVRPEPRVYVVRDKDTLSEIALRELGTSKRWPEIIDQNPGLNPAKLLVGARLKLPQDGEPAHVAARPQEATSPATSAPTATTATTRGRKAAAAATSDVSYRVVADDSLWRIAERSLGDGERWREILALNPGLDAKKLLVGTELKLPSGTKPAAARLLAQNTPSAASSAKKGRVR